MHLKTHFFTFEWKRFWTGWNIILVLLFTFMSLRVVHNDARDYKEVLKNNEELAEFEIFFPTTIKNYTRYAVFGVQLGFNPPPSSILFYQSGIFRELTARVGGFLTVDLNVSMKSKNSFYEKAGKNSDFSSLLFLYGSLFSSFLGTGTFKYSKYQRMISNSLSHRSLFWGTLISRYLIIVIISLVLILLAVLTILLHGINLDTIDYKIFTCFLIGWLIVSFVFFLIGAILGFRIPKVTGIASVLIVWFLLFHFIPSTIDDFHVDSSFKIPSSISVKMKKFLILNSFETRAKKEAEYKEESRMQKKLQEIALSIFTNELLKINEVEQRLIDSENAHAKKHHSITLFTPTTFYNSLISELSGKGFIGLIDFHRFAHEFNNKFFRFFYKKKFKSDDKNFKNVVSIVNTNENIFSNISRIPYFFLKGVILTSFWVIFLLVILFYRFKSYFLDANIRRLKKPVEFNGPARKGEANVYLISGDTVMDAAWGLICGRLEKLGAFIKGGDEFLGEIKFQDADIQYFCPPDSLPTDVKGGDFVYFTCKLLGASKEEVDKLLTQLSEVVDLEQSLGELTNAQRCIIIIHLASRVRKEVYFFHDTVTGLPFELTKMFISLINDLTARGATVIYFTRDDTFRNVPLDLANSCNPLTLWKPVAEKRIEKEAKEKTSNDPKDTNIEEDYT